MGPVLVTYLRQLFWPNDLSVHYAWPPMSLTEGRVLLAWALVLGLVGAWAMWARRDRRVAFAGLIALIGLAPTANVIPAPYLQADRYTHMALVGVSYLVVAGLAASGRVPARVMVIAFVALVMELSLSLT